MQPPETERRVHRMPDELANRIAAGEVVERPASAVKELLENALDAGARRVRVELEEGGLRLIRVTDDGSGMTPDDARLCVERHATSKLLDSDGLFGIRTLGFRGEALPSIASVSRFELHSKPHGQLGGTRVTIHGGALVDVAEAGCPPGTEIVVRDLFYNTPARLKFLKTRATEVRHVVEAVQRLALPHPEVAFTLSHQGRQVLDLPAVQDPAERVWDVLGADDADHMYPLISAEQDGVVCTGFFGQPTLSKRTTAGILTFVNGRYVRDRTVMGAVRVGYQGMVDKGRHPVVVLFLDVPSAAVDVNVHPMKTEVRFHGADAVFRAVRRALANSLAAAPWVPGRDAEAESWAPHPTGPRDAPSAGALNAQQRIPVRSYTLHGAAGAPGGQLAPRAGWASGGTSGGGEDPAGQGRWRASGAPDASMALADTLDWGASLPPDGFFQSLHYIGHFRGAYLLASDGAGLVVVDQHAAHERITFERLRLAWRDRRTEERQPLLVPQVIALDPVRAATLQDQLEFFERLGFELEPFGGNDFALKAVPAILSGRRGHTAMLKDTLDEIADAGRSSRIDEAVDAILVRMACHGSIRAGDTMTRDEVQGLYAELDAVDFGANCPHGRPVYFRMSLEELETRFERR